MRAKYLPALLATLLATACGSAPPAPQPALVKAVLEVESDGAKRYARGDYPVAARRFAEAARLATSIDDRESAARNRLHLARTELAMGRADAALALLTDDPGVEARLLQAQAQLARGRAEEARRALARIDCAPPCTHAASLRLLQARAAATPAEAAAHAEAALALLTEEAAAAETANAWRTLAAAKLALGDATARTAAHAALEIDRRLALPEKIARDWLLIGDIEARVGAGGTAGEAAKAARATYERALQIAVAAGIDEVANQARRALDAPSATRPAAPSTTQSTTRANAQSATPPDAQPDAQPDARSDAQTPK